jgi:hypothetical protein
MPSRTWLVVAVALSAFASSCTQGVGGRCSETSNCKSGLSCCSGFCSDTTKDLANCGGCGLACQGINAAALCLNSVCRLACTPGFGDCNQSGADGCEADLSADPANCGACRLNCGYDNALGICTASACSMGACQDGYADCDKQGGNGCEVHTAESADNCGACGHHCLIAHGSAACAASACAVRSCDTGWGDCDLSPDGGCETNTQASAKNCGGCNQPCPEGNACVEGACRPAELLLFGGFTDTTDAVAIADVYHFDFVAKTWSVLTVDTTSPGPEARGYHNAVWDRVGNRMVVFGGYDGTNLVAGDTWTLDFNVTPPAWSHLNVTGAPPTARMFAASGWDPATRRWYVFGGTADTFGGTSNNDLYMLDLETLNWTQILGATPPQGRMMAAGGWDQTTNQLVIHGGNTDFYTDLDDLWVIDPAAAAPAWTQLSPGAAPTARSAEAFFDGAAPLALFGGGSDMYGTSPTFYRDVRVLDVSTPGWAKAGGVGITPRAFPATATLGTSRYVYGGMSWDANFTQTVFSDTWELELPSGVWTRLHAGGGDAPPVQHGMTVVGKL